MEAAPKTRPLASQRPPFLDVRPLRGPHPKQAEIVEPRSIGHQIDVGERGLGAEAPWVPLTQSVGPSLWNKGARSGGGLMAGSFSTRV